MVAKITGILNRTPAAELDAPVVKSTGGSNRGIQFNGVGGMFRALRGDLSGVTMSESKRRKNFNALCESIYSKVYNSYPFLDENERAYIAGKILNRYLEDYTPGTNNNGSQKAPPPASTTGVGASGPLSQSGASQLVNQVSDEVGRPVSPEEIRQSQDALQNAGVDPSILRATFAAQQGLAEAIFGGETPPQVMAAKPAPDPMAKFRDAFGSIDALARQLADQMPNGYVNGMLSPAVITGVAKNLPPALKRYYAPWRASKTTQHMSEGFLFREGSFSDKVSKVLNKIKSYGPTISKKDAIKEVKKLPNKNGEAVKKIITFIFYCGDIIVTAMLMNYIFNTMEQIRANTGRAVRNTELLGRASDELLMQANPDVKNPDEFYNIPKKYR